MKKVQMKIALDLNPVNKYQTDHKKESCLSLADPPWFIEMSSPVDQKQKEMALKVESTAMRMDKIEEKMRYLSQEEAELYRSELAEIKSSFKGIVFFKFLEDKTRCKLKTKERNYGWKFGNAARTGGGYQNISNRNEWGTYLLFLDFTIEERRIFLCCFRPSACFKNWPNAAAIRPAPAERIKRVLASILYFYRTCTFRNKINLAKNSCHNLLKNVCKNLL